MIIKKLLLANNNIAGRNLTFLTLTRSLTSKTNRNRQLLEIARVESNNKLIVTKPCFYYSVISFKSKNQTNLKLASTNNMLVKAHFLS